MESLFSIYSTMTISLSFTYIHRYTTLGLVTVSFLCPINSLCIHSQSHYQKTTSILRAFKHIRNPTSFILPFVTSFWSLVCSGSFWMCCSRSLFYTYSNSISLRHHPEDFLGLSPELGFLFAGFHVFLSPGLSSGFPWTYMLGLTKKRSLRGRKFWGLTYLRGLLLLLLINCGNSGYKTLAWISFSLRIPHFAFEKTKDTDCHFFTICWGFFPLKLSGPLLYANFLKSHNNVVLTGFFHLFVSITVQSKSLHLSVLEISLISLLL